MLLLRFQLAAPIASLTWCLTGRYSCIRVSFLPFGILESDGFDHSDRNIRFFCFSLPVKRRIVSNSHRLRDMQLDRANCFLPFVSSSYLCNIRSIHNSTLRYRFIAAELIRICIYVSQKIGSSCRVFTAYTDSNRSSRSLEKTRFPSFPVFPTVRSDTKR